MTRVERHDPGITGEGCGSRLSDRSRGADKTTGEFFPCLRHSFMGDSSGRTCGQRIYRLANRPEMHQADLTATHQWWIAFWTTISARRPEVVRPLGHDMRSYFRDISSAKLERKIFQYRVTSDIFVAWDRIFHPIYPKSDTIWMRPIGSKGVWSFRNPIYPYFLYSSFTVFERIMAFLIKNDFIYCDW